MHSFLASIRASIILKESGIMPGNSKKRVKRNHRSGKPAPSAQPTKTAQSASAAPKRQRSTLLTVFLILIIVSGIVEAAVYIGQRRSDAVLTAPVLLALGIVHALANIAAAFGIWNWKKWGLYVYAASGVLGVIVGTIAVGVGAVFAGVLPVIIIAYLVKAHWSWFE
jgi:hypothetical protein